MRCPVNSLECPRWLSKPGFDSEKPPPSKHRPHIQLWRITRGLALLPKSGLGLRTVRPTAFSRLPPSQVRKSTSGQTDLVNWLQLHGNTARLSIPVCNVVSGGANSESGPCFWRRGALPTAGTHEVRGFIEDSEFVDVHRNDSNFNNLLLHPLLRH